MAPRSARETMCSRPRAWENIGSASIMRCLRLPRNWWTLRLRYVFLFIFICHRMQQDAAGCRRAHARALAQNLFCIVSDFMGPRRAEPMPPVGQCWLTIHQLLVSLFRSRTKNARSCPRDRARVPSRRPLSKSRFSNCPHSCRPSHGTKNTSARARTATSVPFGARRDGSSTLV